MLFHFTALDEDFSLADESTDWTSDRSRSRDDSSVNHSERDHPRNKNQSNDHEERETTPVSPRDYHELGKMGGAARRKTMTHNDYVELGRKGGAARRQQMTHEDYVAMGRKGGAARRQQMTHQDYVEMGRKGGAARREQLTRVDDEHPISSQRNARQHPHKKTS